MADSSALGPAGPPRWLWVVNPVVATTWAVLERVNRAAIRYHHQRRTDGQQPLVTRSRRGRRAALETETGRVVVEVDPEDLADLEEAR